MFPNARQIPLWAIKVCLSIYQVEAQRHYASISPKAELKVHVFLNVGHHQRRCKVVTSGTSVKLNVFFLLRVYNLYSLRRGQTDIL